MARHRHQPGFVARSWKQVYQLTSVVNTFVENVLPFVLRFINEWRAGKTTIKEAIKRNKNGEKTPPKTEQEIEDQFMVKVEHELSLPDYDLFSESSVV